MSEHTPDTIHKKIRDDIPESELVRELRQAGYAEDDIKNIRILHAVHQELRQQEKNKKMALAILAIFVIVGAAAYLFSPGPAPSSEQGTKAMSFYVKNDLGSELDGANLMIFDKEKHMVFDGKISANSSVKLGGEEYTYIVSCPDGYGGIKTGTKKAGDPARITIQCKSRESNYSAPAAEETGKTQKDAALSGSTIPANATTSGNLQSQPEEATLTANITGGNATVADISPPTNTSASMVVSTAGEPAGWQNTDAYASVNCSAAQGGCRNETYRLKAYSSNPVTCPAEYGQYTQASPATISSHAWVCASAKDAAGNAAFSMPSEFKVDKNPPSATSSHMPASPTTNDMLNITISATDDIGLSEIKIYVDSALKKTCVAGGVSASCIYSSAYPAGAYYYNATIRDLAGNTKNTQSGYFTASLPADTTPPAIITDLAASGSTPNSINITWTSPGDDANVRAAAQYDLRYSTSPITDSNWGSATQASGEPPPKSPGSTETFTVVGLNPGTTYYFAIKTADEIPNWSGISNVPGGTTTAQYIIKVLDLSYIPTINGKVDISLTGDWRNENINDLLNNIDSLRNGLVDTLTKGSKYSGYKDPAATAVLSYNVIEKKVFYTPVPPSATYKGMDNAPSADHMGILNGLNICSYVENQGVNEVWIWMYHTSRVAPIESNMAGPYGDISNSYRENDLPVCAKTYTVYDYNYGRSYSMAVEDHTHQIEAILNYVDYNLFWNLFVGTNNGGGRCGWTHYPPNGVRDYDWNNENNVLSDCEDWKPDGSGQKKWTNCRTWSTNANACDNDEGLSFKTWWMQNIPGKGNNLYYNGKKLKNWWMFIGDFDRAMTSRTLVYE